LYFNVTVQAEEGKVFFYETKKKRNFLSERFNVIIEMNDKTKLFFRPPRFWDANITIQNKWPQIFYSHLLGDVLHGFETNNAPGTKTLLFEPPFFLFLKHQTLIQIFYLLLIFKNPIRKALFLP